MPTSTGVLDLNYLLGGLTGSGNIFYGQDGTESSDFTAYIRAMPSDNEDLSAEIMGPEVVGDLTGLIQGFAEGTDDLGFNLVGWFSEEQDLTSWYVSYAEGSHSIRCHIRPQQSGTTDLPGLLQAVPPIDLEAKIFGFSYEDFEANLNGIGPADLIASIRSREFRDLFGLIDGHALIDLTGTITGVHLHELSSYIFGTAEGDKNLLAEINSDRINRLFCTISGFASEQINLDSLYFAIAPSDLEGTITQVPPSEITASILSFQEPEELTASISGTLTPEHLTATIGSRGAFRNIVAKVNSAATDSIALLANIDPVNQEDLNAYINQNTQSLLEASITASGPFGNEVLHAQINSLEYEDFSASISSVDSPTLTAIYSPTEPHDLTATIFPDVFYIDALIPFSTFGVKEFNAYINTKQCNYQSFAGNLPASYDIIFKEDLQASIFASHNLCKAADLVRINLRRSRAVTDYLKIFIDPPAISTDYIKLLILNSPYGDMTATINGVQSSSDLAASITTTPIGSFHSVDPSRGMWVDPATGRRRIIRFLFGLTGKTYYYSQLANRTFPEDRRDKIQLIVETFDPIDEDENLAPTMMGEKRNVRRCFVSDLTGFSSWDEAVRFGIRCSAGMFDDLGATIVGTGDSKSIRASIFPVDDNRSVTISGRIIPVKSLPDLNAEINASGGFSGLKAALRGLMPGFTESPFINDELNEHFIPLLITFGDGEPQLILQKVISTGNIVVSSSPSLEASIRGVVSEDLSVTISGTS